MTMHYRPVYPATEIAKIAPDIAPDMAPEALLPRLHFQRRQSLYRDSAKRVLDLISVAVLALPALLILAIFIPLVALDGAAPLYRQARIGRGGKRFTMWKLRSMVADADARLEAYLAANPGARIEWDRHQKLRNDPRVTRIGSFIRRASIDELPQLWNVLKGDMSLVGPRPMMPNQQEIYPGNAYYELRPGITGAWQVSDRHESSFAERALFDTAYYNNLSLGTDLSIMARTVGVVLRAAGV